MTDAMTGGATGTTVVDRRLDGYEADIVVTTTIRDGHDTHRRSEISRLVGHAVGRENVLALLQGRGRTQGRYLGQSHDPSQSHHRLQVDRCLFNGEMAGDNLPIVCHLLSYNLQACKP